MPHRRRLELEAVEGVAGGQARGRGRIGVGQAVDIDLDAAAARETDALADGAERPVAEQVHLDETNRLDGAHLELGDHDFLGGALERHVMRERAVADNDAAAVDRQVARRPLEPFGEAESLGERRLAPVQAPRVGEPVEALDVGFLQVARDQARELVDAAVGDPEGLGGLAKRRARPERGVGGDHGDAIGAVGLVDVSDDLVAPAPAEVDVEIGTVTPGRVEEALEAEPVAQRVHVGDAEAVRHDRAGSGAAAHGGDAAGASEPDDLGDQQEVVREAHAPDHVQLVP